jgi:hypothetical protein
MAFGIADSAKCPDLCRWIFSPGYVLSMHLPPLPAHVDEGLSKQSSKTLGRFIGVGLLTNVAYYYVVLWTSFVGFDLIRQKRRVEA